MENLAKGYVGSKKTVMMEKKSCILTKITLKKYPTEKLYSGGWSNKDILHLFESSDEVKPGINGSGVDYFEIDNNGQFSKISLNVGDDVPSNTYVKIIVPPGTEDDATAYTGTGPCVLDNGTVINTPVFLDAASYDMAIDTSSLITKTGVMAGDMANIEGIGLSVYEIKMAYLLDHEFNLSAMPNDVEAELIPTVLDTIADND
mgnify:CR=1 FL=1